MKTWKIAYTVQDGEYEYGDDFTCELDAAELDGNTVAAVIADHWDIDPAERQQFLQELDAEGYAFLPKDGRAIKELGWEPVDPIVVTVRGGVVQAVSGVPEGITVEVRDWDDGELDASGEIVPGIALWEGPC